MQINKDGLLINNLSDMLSENTEKMRKTLGSDFYIKPEGAVDNILTTISLMEKDLQEQVVYLIKQFDPETAEGTYQDALYERLGLYRKKESATSFVMTISGEPGESIDIEEIYIQDTETKDFFYNASEVVFDENGQADVTFKSFIFDAIEVSQNAEYEIVTRPDVLTGIDKTSIREIEMGCRAESDLEFRERFHQIKTINQKCTRNAILENLSEYTGGLEYLSLHDCNSDEDVPAGRLLITARPIVSDEEFAKHILDNVIAGVDFLGNTTVAVPLSNGQFWDVSFQKALEVPVEFFIKTKIRSGYYENSVFNKVRNNILTYLESHIFGLKSSIWATEFIIPVLEVDGVDAVTEILIKRAEDSAYATSVNMAADEYPAFYDSNINLSLN